MVSLKTIAEKCGVSTATVSKALNDQRYQRRDKEPCQKRQQKHLVIFQMRRREH